MFVTVLSILAGIPVNILSGLIVGRLEASIYGVEENLRRNIEKWAKKLPAGWLPSAYSFCSVFFENLTDSRLGVPETQKKIKQMIEENRIPDLDAIEEVLEARRQRIKDLGDVADFYKLPYDIVKAEIKNLATVVQQTLAATPAMHSGITLEIRDLVLVCNEENRESHRRLEARLDDFMVGFDDFIKRFSEHYERQPHENRAGDTKLLPREAQVKLDSRVTIALFLCILIKHRARMTVTSTSLEEDTRTLYRLLFDHELGAFMINKYIARLKKLRYIYPSAKVAPCSPLVIRVTNQGEEMMHDLADSDWALMESKSYYDNRLSKPIEFAFFKFIVEKIPSRYRFGKLSYIIKYLQQNYSALCWSIVLDDVTICVPFQVIEEMKGRCLSAVQGSLLYEDDLIIDPKYIEYYEDSKGAHNGSVYRLLDWRKNLKEVIMEIGTDRGYFDFQATCGKLRNEIEHTPKEILDRGITHLDYRAFALHSTTQDDDIARHLKKRVVKVGIETCTIIVDRDEQGAYVNPRIPVIFRNDKVAEYPDFTMVVPSGAYQAGVLLDETLTEDNKRLIGERIDWEFSLKRELGEELFGCAELDKPTISGINTIEYSISSEVAQEAILCAPQALGIDLYIGSGGLLVTLIIDYKKTMSILETHRDHDSESTIPGQMADFFKRLNTDGTTTWKEGKIRLFQLDEQLLRAISRQYYANVDPSELKVPQYGTGEKIPFKPMIPSGVVSTFYAWKKYQELISGDRLSVTGS